MLLQVDWSVHNVLAVGLGTCVYLWSACTSKVTKLCDLQPADSICSVAWTQRGTYLAVGTHLGEVQVRACCEDLHIIAMFLKRSPNIPERFPKLVECSLSFP
jgi:WD40 repeat protein